MRFAALSCTVALLYHAGAHEVAKEGIAASAFAKGGLDSRGLDVRKRTLVPFAGGAMTPALPQSAMASFIPGKFAWQTSPATQRYDALAFYENLPKPDLRQYEPPDSPVSAGSPPKDMKDKHEKNEVEKQGEAQHRHHHQPPLPPHPASQQDEVFRQQNVELQAKIDALVTAIHDTKKEVKDFRDLYFWNRIFDSVFKSFFRVIKGTRLEEILFLVVIIPILGAAQLAWIAGLVAYEGARLTYCTTANGCRKLLDKTERMLIAASEYINYSDAQLALPAPPSPPSSPPAPPARPERPPRFELNDFVNPPMRSEHIREERETHWSRMPFRRLNINTGVVSDCVPYNLRHRERRPIDMFDRGPHESSSSSRSTTAGGSGRHVATSPSTETAKEHARASPYNLRQRGNGATSRAPSGSGSRHSGGSDDDSSEGDSRGPYVVVKSRTPSVSLASSSSSSSRSTHASTSPVYSSASSASVERLRRFREQALSGHLNDA